MITSSRLRTKATMSIFYLILFFILGIYLLFETPAPLRPSGSTKSSTGAALVSSSRAR